MKIGAVRYRSRIRAKPAWNNIGGPGSTATFSTEMTGNREPGHQSMIAPSGTSANLRRAALSRSPKWLRNDDRMRSSVTTRRAKHCATAAIVTSSCVGPMPPLVNTDFADPIARRSESTMTGTSSGTVSMRRSSTPSARSSRESQGPFSSATLAERISLPITTMAAVLTLRSPDRSASGQFAPNRTRESS